MLGRGPEEEHYRHLLTQAKLAWLYREGIVAEPMTDAELIEHLTRSRHDQAKTIRSLWRALETIRDMPLPEQDNMISANMRKVAKDILDCNPTDEGSVE